MESHEKSIGKLQPRMEFLEAVERTVSAMKLMPLKEEQVAS